MRVCAVGGHLYIPLSYVPWGNLCTTTIAYVSQLVLGGIAPVSLYALKTLTAGAAFVPEDVFWCGSKDKSHVLQHALWAEDTHYL